MIAPTAEDITRVVHTRLAEKALNITVAERPRSPESLTKGAWEIRSQLRARLSNNSLTKSTHAMPRISIVKTALLFAFICVTTASLTGVILNPLIRGTEGVLKRQPVLDWDKDTCYQTSTIDSNDNTNPGLEPSSSESVCRDASRLSHCNTYAHDDADPRNVRSEGNHSKLVAHYDTGNTASLRLAKAADDKIQNALGRWQACHLQQIDVMNNTLASRLLKTNWGSAHMDLPDGRFQERLEKYMPKQARQNFFTALDWWSPEVVPFQAKVRCSA
ncbi:necrosis inducing protein-domain-containing protein [Alternaria rosae]|uniref:necrosis inducing protein-domain-containing protein n=1 Tax=Alternaria rosae TaxID=1187941 RepID=UPI001E8D78E3|nr:necrosis inducing protein-domain-containing protein [Alternaria rosae]KAH6875227.1 necrosis inducing protein-domain-containing protein [Alternaria rosae]